MDFKEATDRLAAIGIGLADVAAALGLSHQTARAMRLEPGGKHARTPPAPDVWRPVFARLAREREEEARALSLELTNLP
jgi:hypothetical protein